MYNITGWSGGGRRPLSYNLMPGQFRNTRVNVFQNNTIINNNIGAFGGCYDYDCGCGCGGSNKMSWMDWTMMGGMLLNGLGNIFACFWGGGGGGGAEKAKADAPDEFASLKTLYPKHTFSKVGDTYVCVTKDGKQIRGTSPEDLLNKLGGEDDDDVQVEGGGGTKPNQALIDAGKELGLELSADGTKWKVGNLEFEIGNLKGAVAAKNATVKEEGPKTEETGLGTGWADFKWADLDITKLDDDKTTPLSMTATGDTTVSTEFGTNVKAPKTITVKKRNMTYKFELIDDKSKVKDGNPMYKCTSNGATLSGDKIQEYLLKPDGTFFQNTNTVGYGTSLGKSVTSNPYTTS